MASNDLNKVAEVLFTKRPVPVTFHLPAGEKVEATVIGWEMRSGLIDRAVVTVTQATLKGFTARTEG